MSPDLQCYLEAVESYCSEVTVLGWGEHPSSARANLEHVYVQPEAQAERGYRSEAEHLPWDPPQDATALRSFPARGPGDDERGTPPQPVLSLVNANPRLLLMGQQGLGKTTTLKFLAARAAREWTTSAMAGGKPRGAIPVFIELHRWKPGQTLTDSLRAALPEPIRAAATDSAWQEVCNLLQSGRCQVLADGLDEYRGDRERLLSALAPRAEQALRTLILTSRPFARPTQDGWDAVPLYFLRELKPEDVQRLCDALCPAEPARTRLREFARGPGAALCRVPLFLAMMSRLAEHRPAEEMPRTRAGAFECFFEALEQWEQEKPDRRSTGEPAPLNSHEMRDALAPLALDLRLRRRDALHEADLHGALDRQVGRQTAPAALQYLTRLQILRKVGPTYEFVYEVVLDYFAACGLADADDPYHKVEGRLHWPGLREVIPMAVGLLPDLPLSLGWTWEDKLHWLWQRRAVRAPVLAVSRLLRALGRGGGLAGEAVEVSADAGTPPADGGHWRDGREYFIERVLRSRSWLEAHLRRDFSLALRCAGECGRLDPQLAESLTRRAGSARRTGGVGAALAEALLAAGRCPSIAEPLLELSRDAEWYVRWAAARALAAAASEPTVQQRLLELMRDEEAYVRGAATEALAGAASEPDVQHRLLELSRDDEGHVRHAATEALAGAASEPDVQHRLLELSRDAEGYVRGAATEAFAGAASEPTVQHRLLELSRDDERDVRGAATRALAGAASEPDVQHRLLELIRDDEWDVRWAATEALAGAASELDVQHRLLELSRGGASVRWAATQALAGAASEADVQHRLLELSRDDEGHVRQAATEALAGAGSEPHVQQRLLELSRDDHSYVRGAATRALTGAASEPTVQQRLLELSRDDDADVRRAATWTWVLAPAASEPTVQQRLLELSRDDQSYVRRAATWALAAAASKPDVQQRLLQLSRDDDAHVRGAATRGLAAAASEPDVQQRLLQLIRDAHGDVLGAATRGLAAAASEPDVQQRLLELSRDANWYVRPAATEALAGAASEPTVQQRLLELSRDDDGDVRRVATGALAGAASEPDVQQRLLELRRDPQGGVRGAATLALRQHVDRAEAEAERRGETLNDYVRSLTRR